MKPQDLVTDRLQETFAKLSSSSASLCLAKWLQVTLHLHNGQSQSCHHVKSTPIDAKQLALHPSAMHNTPIKMDARGQMLAGQRPSECSYCWKIEERGRLSDRITKSAEPWALPHLNEVLQSGVGPRMQPRYVEISFDSVCNLKCAYCGPSYSTAWMNEIKAKGPYPTSKLYNNLWLAEWNGTLPLPPAERQAMVDRFWDWWPELVQGLQNFRITGGEPLLSQETWKVLAWLAGNAMPQLQFAINTNLSVPEDRIANLIQAMNSCLNNVARFTIYTSVDTVGARADYIRFGLKYDQWLKNVRLILQSAQAPITLSLMVSVNALSLSGLKDLMVMVLDLRRDFPQHRIGLDTPYLQNPQHLSVEILDPSFESYIDAAVEFMHANPGGGKTAGFWKYEIVKVDRIRELIRRPSLRAWHRRILRRDFYQMLTEYDRRRGTDFLTTFPEYTKFWQRCRRWLWN